MYRWIITFLIFLILTSVTPTIAADWDNWYWRFGAGPAPYYVDYVAPPDGQLGVSQGSSDTIGGSLMTIYGDLPMVRAAIYHENGTDGWQDDTGFYNDDFRAPVPLVPGSQKNWRIYVWATPTMPATYDIRFWMDYMMGPSYPDPPYDLALKLISKPASVSGGPVVGSIWKLDWFNQNPVVDLPMYRTDNGLTAYVFEFSVTAVPEPSSLLALTCGLGCLAGVIRRRRL